MDQIPIHEVIVDMTERRPIDLDALRELKSSFLDIGQIQPIVLDENKKLMAGAHRLQAAKELEWPTIGFLYFNDLTPLQKAILEFDENHKRKQLSWQQEAAAIAKIHGMKIAEQPGWTATATAEALNLSLGKVTEDLILAQNLTNERVTGRPSRRGAITTVKRERELSLVRELAKRRSAIDVEKSDTIEMLRGGAIHNDDCLTVLRAIQDNTIDLIVTDPPWGIDLDKSSQWSQKWLATYDDSAASVAILLKDAFREMYRVLKPSNHFYTFFPIDKITWWLEALNEVGFIVRPRPLVWFKVGQPSITDPYTTFLPCYEGILWGWKPGTDNVRRIFSRPVPEGFGFPRQPGLWHENEKPTEMLERYIEASSEVGETVLDPFAGGGSTLASAFAIGRNYLGVEKDTVNWKKCCERLHQLEEREEDTTEEC